MVNVLGCHLEVSEFKLQSRFQTNTIRKSVNVFIPAIS